MKLNEAVNDAIDRLLPACWALADWITNHPEIGGQEVMAVQKLTDFLRGQGYTVTSPCGTMPHSFLAEDLTPANRDKPKVALLCEYDALPEVGHACGHSIHGVMSVLAALALREALPDFPFRLDVAGTPDEESMGGKVVMQREHVFDGYAFAIMGHIDNINCPQIKVVASDGLYITFHGVATHASSSPERGVNALNAAQFFMHASDMLRQHLTPDCQIHGIITDGGEAPNTTPDKITLNYYYRAATVTHMAILRERLMRCIEGACVATGCTSELCPNHSGMFAELSYLPTAIRVIGETFDALGMPWCEMAKAEGSTDAGNVDLSVPTFHLEIKGTDSFCDFHTREFEAQMHGARGQKTLRDGARVLAQVINRLAENPDELRAIQAEHRAYRQLG